jgi:uncharacterized protein (UPF0371 family)
MEEVQKKTMDNLQKEEDKVNHLNKLKNKLEQTLGEFEDNLEREKKIRGDVEKSKRKLEQDLSLLSIIFCFLPLYYRSSFDLMFVNFRVSLKYV